jgi:hypothetical protein
MWAFASLMDLIQSSLFFDLCSQFMILHFLTHSSTIWIWVYLLADFLEVDQQKTCYTILLLSILLTWPIHLNLILINETISKSPYNCISSLLCLLLQQLLIFISPSVFLKTFCSQTASRLPVSELKFHASARWSKYCHLITWTISVGKVENNTAVNIVPNMYDAAARLYWQTPLLW